MSESVAYGVRATPRPPRFVLSNEQPRLHRVVLR